MPFKTPTPFVDVVPAVRVGFTNIDEQSTEMPIGATKRSYAYSNNGKMITNAKFASKQNNEAYSKCADLTGPCSKIYLTFYRHGRRNRSVLAPFSLQARIYASWKLDALYELNHGLRCSVAKQRLPSWLLLRCHNGGEQRHREGTRNRPRKLHWILQERGSLRT